MFNLSCELTVTLECIRYIYRLHPKDDGRLYFQSVQVQVGGSQVQVGGIPGQGPGRGVPGPGGGVPGLRSGGVPSVRSGGGGTQSK